MFCPNSIIHLLFSDIKRWYWTYFVMIFIRTKKLQIASILFSQVLSPSPSATMTIILFFMSVSPLLPCKFLLLRESEFRVLLSLTVTKLLKMLWHNIKWNALDIVNIYKHYQRRNKYWLCRNFEIQRDLPMTARLCSEWFWNFHKFKLIVPPYWLHLWVLEL